MSALACLAILSGCVTTGGVNRLEPLTVSLSASPAGKGLERGAVRKAVLAELKALDMTPTGGTSDWKAGKNANGSVSPGPPFEVSGQVCRRLTHRITQRDQQQTHIETACRSEDGVWAPVGS
ncbi:MAG: hypothetical protein KDJ80_11615 [Nitratireductor sp.]|nr:hypothetical protein [Nitratireductor sp.]